MVTPCQLLVDPPLDAAWNMGFDEYLLHQAADHNVATLRFYAWTPGTLSLGYFQSHTQRQLHPPSHSAPLVRRASGGGAILHDRELTYSIALPPGHPLARDTEPLYFAAHRAIIEVLQQLLRETPGEFQLCDQAVSPPDGEPFLCFQRRARGDLLFVPAAEPLAGPVPPDRRFKVGGSAQRRHRGAVLQHGSLLVERSPLAPELPGISDLVGQTLAASDLQHSLASTVATRLDLDLAVATTSRTMADEEGCRQGADKFTNPQWTLRR